MRKEIVIVGESYFDRMFLKLLVEKYKGSDFYFNLISKHSNKTSVLKDFDKYRDRAINSEKYGLDIAIIFSCDLDFDGDCISSFLTSKKINPLEFSDNFLLTIQVREIESWILSDSFGLEKWTQIPRINFERYPINFEISEKSTTTFLNIVSQKSSKFKRLLCNESGGKSDYYNDELLDFVTSHFDPERARINNKSLDRFLNKVINI